MAVTEPRAIGRKIGRTFKAGSCLVLLAFTIVGYQNCSVDLASTTPGASSAACEPSSQQLTAFEPIFNDILQSRATLPSNTTMRYCGNCHTSEAGFNSGASVYLVTQGDTTTDPTLIKTNFCSLSEKASMIESKILNGPHTGGVFPASDVQALLDFVRANY